jgi:hypothetical protein
LLIGKAVFGLISENQAKNELGEFIPDLAAFKTRIECGAVIKMPKFAE